LRNEVLKNFQILFQTVSNCFTTVSRDFATQIAEINAFSGLQPSRNAPAREDGVAGRSVPIPLRGELLLRKELMRMARTSSGMPDESNPNTNAERSQI
jgi:hypothetical protein